MPSDLALVVDGVSYVGWKSIRVTTSIESGAGKFSLGVSENRPGDAMGRELHPGLSCQVQIAGEPVITGYIDEIGGSHDGRTHEITASGRDRVGQLVDCSAVHTSGEWKDRTLLQLATELCKPFGVKVLAEAPIGAPFPKWKLQQGETVYETIERAGRHRGLLAVSNGLGDLVLTRAGTGRASDSLLLGENVLHASWSWSDADRYSDYIGKGQQAGTSLLSVFEAASPKAEAKDPLIKLNRPFIVIAEEPGDSGTLLERVRWEAAVRAGRSRQLGVTVQGWRQSTGELWRPNHLVQVDDELAGLRREMLIASASYSVDQSGGSVTSLSLALPEAYVPEPLKEPEQGSELFG